MPLTVRFDNTTTCPQQMQFLPPAGPNNDGVITEEMVQKLNSISSGGAFSFTVTGVKTADYDAAIGELVQVDPSGGAFNVNLPAITAGNKGQMIAVKSLPAGVSTDVTIVAAGGQTIEGAVTFTLNGVEGKQMSALFVSDGVSNWIFLVWFFA